MSALARAIADALSIPCARAIDGRARRPVLRVQVSTGRCYRVAATDDGLFCWSTSSVDAEAIDQDDLAALLANAETYRFQ